MQKRASGGGCRLLCLARRSSLAALRTSNGSHAAETDMLHYLQDWLCFSKVTMHTRKQQHVMQGCGRTFFSKELCILSSLIFLLDPIFFKPAVLSWWVRTQKWVTQLLYWVAALWQVYKGVFKCCAFTLQVSEFQVSSFSSLTVCSLDVIENRLVSSFLLNKFQCGGINLGC